MLFVKNEQPFAHDKSSKIDVGVFPSRTNPGDITGKRPLLDNAEHQLFGCKRPKQVEHDTKQGSFLLNAISDKSFSALHDDDSQGREVDSLPEKFAAKVTSSHWYEGSDSDEEDCLDSLNSSLQENPLLSYVDGYQGLSGYNQLEEFYEPFYDRYDRSPVRPVATGPNNQAEIPEWRSNSYRSANKFLNDNASAINSADLLHDDEDDSDKWLGTCIIPMPDSALLASDVTVLQGKTECSCFDKGSIRCVRQHVLEAREGLRKSLGQDKFMNLGFTNMGEYIAEEWTEEEERMFHEVILSNPASLGKNFWDVLAQVFPTRTTKDLVSYYFNVFMLRKRAAQNRYVPLNADSDNDECEEYEDSAYAFEEEEEDEDEDEDDSAIESLEDQGNSTDDKDDEEFDGDECDGYSGAENGDFCSAYEPFSASKSNFLPSLQLIDRNLDNCTYEHDVQDDSCTSYEGQIHAPDSLCAPVDIMDTRHNLIEDHELREYKNYNLGGDHELFDGHCDPKAWDLAFTCGAKKDDFLSTCNVIEEVCGKDHERKS